MTSTSSNVKLSGEADEGIDVPFVGMEADVEAVMLDCVDCSEIDCELSICDGEEQAVIAKTHTINNVKKEKVIFFIGFVSLRSSSINTNYVNFRYGYCIASAINHNRLPL